MKNTGIAKLVTKFPPRCDSTPRAVQFRREASRYGMPSHLRNSFTGVSLIGASDFGTRYCFQPGYTDAPINRSTVSAIGKRALAPTNEIKHTKNRLLRAGTPYRCAGMS